MKTVKRKKPSGGAFLRAAGKVPLLVGMLPDEKQIIRVAAAMDGISMCGFLLKYGLKAAEKINPAR